MTMLPQYLDQLDSARQKVWPKLAAFVDSFTLAGGTAIMLQIGHRQSYDFDCFSPHKLPDDIVKKTKKVFGSSTLLKTETSEIVTVTTPEKVEVTFVYYPFLSLKKPLLFKPVSLAHLDDLSANKAYTIGRRPAWRDYVDIFFLLKWNLYSLKKIIDLSEQKYQGEFNAKLFLNQLTYFDDLDIMPIVFIKEKYTPEEIKNFLTKQVEEYLKIVLPR